MKARVKATGDIIDVKEVTKYDSNYNPLVYYKAENGFPYKEEQLDFEDLTEGKVDVKEKSLPKDEPDYWEKLHHQAAIATMQGILTNNELWKDIMRGVYPPERQKYLAKEVNKYATELVNKLKEEEK